MRLTESHLRKIIREAIDSSHYNILNNLPLMRLLSKIAKLRPLPASVLNNTEQDLAEELRQADLIAWDLGVKGWTITQAGLDMLGRW